jgi:formylglycine-generating enzyme required for sulfatase activity
MVLVPAGEFIMGSDEVDKEAKAMQYGVRRPWYANERPKRRVYLEGFYIDRFEVTNARYSEFVDGAGGEVPEYWKRAKADGLAKVGKYPVTDITWHGAQAYCRWRGKRLPTEAEWEKAARGTDGRRFPWGDEFDQNRVSGNTPRSAPLPVGSFESGRSPYGVYDMAGNAAEWTAGWYKQYPGNDFDDPEYGETVKVIRGGAWGSDHYALQHYLRTTDRSMVALPKTRLIDVGFRCAKDTGG